VNTLRRFSAGQHSIPSGTSWYLADLGEFRGKQELYTRQSPQRLKALREHALIESAVSSNRLEGVEVDPKRLHDVLVKPKPLFRDRDEEEVRGYREALSLIHDDFAAIKISEATVRRLHRLTRGEIWDGGVGVRLAALPRGTLGSSTGGSGLFQSRLSLYSSVSRRQWARVTAAVASAMLPSWL
jgi:hypothetical protein